MDMYGKEGCQGSGCQGRVKLLGFCQDGQLGPGQRQRAASSE